jgi:hypothetical protein
MPGIISLVWCRIVQIVLFEKNSCLQFLHRFFLFLFLHLVSVHFFDRQSVLFSVLFYMQTFPVGSFGTAAVEDPILMLENGPDSVSGVIELGK